MNVSFFVDIYENKYDSNKQCIYQIKMTHKHKLQVYLNAHEFTKAEEKAK